MTRFPIAVLCTVAAAVLSLTACGAADGSPTAAGPPAGVTGPPIALDCDAVGSAAPAPEPGALVAAGAFAARICDRTEPGPLLIGPDGRPFPADNRAAGGPTLYHGVDNLVTRLNALPAHIELCTLDQPTFVTLVLAYPGGGRAELTVEQGACRSIESATTVRYGEVGAIMTDLLEQQRFAAAPANGPAAPECAPTRPPGIELRDDAPFAHPKQPVPYPPAVAAICRYRQVPGAEFELLRGVPVPEDTAVRLRTAVDDAVPDDIIGGDAEHCPTPAETVDVLLFLDRAGGGYEVILRGGDCPRLYTDWVFPFAAPPTLIEQVENLVG